MAKAESVTSLARGLVDTRCYVEDALRPRLRAGRGLTYAGIGRWLIALVLSVAAGVGWWLVADRWDHAFDSPATAVAFWATVPVIAALSAAPCKRLAPYLANGVPGVVIFARVVASAFPEPYEPIFARSFVAFLNGVLLLIALVLGAVPIILWRKLAAPRRSR